MQFLLISLLCLFMRAIYNFLSECSWLDRLVSKMLLYYMNCYQQSWVIWFPFMKDLYRLAPPGGMELYFYKQMQKIRARWLFAGNLHSMFKFSFLRGDTGDVKPRNSQPSSTLFPKCQFDVSGPWGWTRFLPQRGQNTQARRRAMWWKKFPVSMTQIMTWVLMTHFRSQQLWRW